MGSASGSIQDLFAKIKAIDAKHGKFDFVLCTGDFFGPLKDLGDDGEDETKLLLEGQIEGTFQLIDSLFSSLTLSSSSN